MKEMEKGEEEKEGEMWGTPRGERGGGVVVGWGLQGDLVKDRTRG